MKVPHRGRIPLTDLINGAIERECAGERALECAALERDGTMILWSADGQPVEVSPDDQLEVVTLMLRQFMPVTHMEEMLVAQAHHGSASASNSMKAIFNLVLRLSLCELDPGTLVIEARKLASGGEVRVSEEMERLLRITGTDLAASAKHDPESVYRVDMDDPIPLDASASEQARLFLRNAYVADCNDAMARVFGLEHGAEVVGMRLWEIMPPHDPSTIETIRTAVRNRFRTVGVPTTIITTSGDVLKMTSSNLGVIEDNHLVRVWGRGTISSNLGRVVAPDLPAGATAALIVICCHTRTVVAWDDNATRTFGYTRDEVLGKPLPIVRNAPLFDALLGRVHHHRGSLTFAGISPWHKDGRKIPVTATSNPIFNAQGGIEAVTFVATPLAGADLTVALDLKALEDALEEVADAPEPRLIRLGKTAIAA
jgi:PAS domain S-box-containing protein